MPQAPEQTLMEYRQTVLRGAPWIRRSALAATALEAMPARPSHAQEALIADIHDSLRGGSQHSRYTQRQRLAALDCRLGEILAERGAWQRIRIHDMAASNAITSLELFDYLRDREPVLLKASDYYDRLHVVNVGDRWRVAFDVDLKPIQYIGRRMMVCARRPDPDAPTVDTIVKPALQAAIIASGAGRVATRSRRHACAAGAERSIPPNEPVPSALQVRGRRECTVRTPARRSLQSRAVSI